MGEPAGDVPRVGGRGQLFRDAHGGLYPAGRWRQASRPPDKARPAGTLTARASAAARGCRGPRGRRDRDECEPAPRPGRRGSVAPATTRATSPATKIRYPPRAGRPTSTAGAHARTNRSNASRTASAWAVRSAWKNAPDASAHPAGQLFQFVRDFRVLVQRAVRHDPQPGLGQPQERVTRRERRWSTVDNSPALRERVQAVPGIRPADVRAGRGRASAGTPAPGTRRPSFRRGRASGSAAGPSLRAARASSGSRRRRPAATARRRSPRGRRRRTQSAKSGSPWTGRARVSDCRSQTWADVRRRSSGGTRPAARPGCPLWPVGRSRMSTA